MTTTVVAGADPDGLGEALEDEDATAVRVVGIVSAGSLNEAGIEDTDLLMLADMDDTTAITVAKEQNPDVHVVAYVYDTLPELAKGQADLAIDLDLPAVDVVTEELI